MWNNSFKQSILWTLDIDAWGNRKPMGSVSYDMGYIDCQRSLEKSSGLLMTMNLQMSIHEYLLGVVELFLQTLHFSLIWLIESDNSFIFPIFIKIATVIGMKNISLSILFAFCSWLMWLNIFPCMYWSFICLLLKYFYSHSLPIFNQSIILAIIWVPYMFWILTP